MILHELPLGPLDELLMGGGLLDVRDLCRLATAAPVAFRERVLPELVAANAEFRAARVLSAAERTALARWGLRAQSHTVMTNAAGEMTWEGWSRHGRAHRDDDRPAEIGYYGGGVSCFQSWFQGGQLHRDGDRPAKIWRRADGSVKLEAWYRRGQRHRGGDRPALIAYFADGSVDREEWYRAGDRLAKMWRLLVFKATFDDEA